MFFKKKEDCLENFYINRFGKTLYSMFFEKYTEKLWGRTPRLISADWGAQRVKGLSVWVVLKDTICKILKIKQAKVETSLIEEYPLEFLSNQEGVLYHFSFAETCWFYPNR